MTKNMEKIWVDLWFYFLIIIEAVCLFVYFLALNSECFKHIILLLIFILLSALEWQTYSFCPAKVKYEQLYSLLERTLNLTLKAVKVFPSVTGGSLMTGKITNVSPLCCCMCHSVTLRWFFFLEWVHRPVAYHICSKTHVLTLLDVRFTSATWCNKSFFFFLIWDSVFGLNRFFIASCFLIEA